MENEQWWEQKLGIGTTHPNISLTLFCLIHNDCNAYEIEVFPYLFIRHFGQLLDKK